MNKYPTVSGKKLIKALLKKGYIKVRQKGSHVSIRHTIDKKITAVLIDTPEDLLKGTINSIRKQLKLSREEFVKILKDC